MSESLLVTDGLTKDYGSHRALDSLSLRIRPGEIVGLLGPNGSGKTTAIRLIMGFLKPTSGSAKVAGYDSWKSSVEVRKRIAYLPGELRLYDGMTGRRLVTFLASLRGETIGSRADELANPLDIDLDRPLTQMSSGMKRKVALVAVLLPNVPLVILDEPTNTLDPTMRDELLVQLAKARDAGKTILFSSHVLQEVEAICDRVIILKKGQLVHEENVVDLRRGKHVTATLAGPVGTMGPDDKPLPAGAIRGQRLDLDHRGPIDRLTAWLAKQPLADIRIEPQGLGPIYQRIHGPQKNLPG
jgi:ABC-2 type transport system ATP-binding protein